VLLCGTCMAARGLTEDELEYSAGRSTMDEPAQTTDAADKALIF
jgi:uncharacterized protein involved in oxidation of intracellular sulfur